MPWLDDYEPVEVRLEQFWTENMHGRVWTELKLMGQHPGELVVIWAAIYRDKADTDPWATGIAHQRILGEPPSGRGGRPNESSPEWTSPYEVCETSAIGRALANAGYAAKGKRASREEVEKTTSANELYDVTEWLEPLSTEQQDALRSWWKEAEGLSSYSARAVPGAWLAVIRKKVQEVMNAQEEAEGERTSAGRRRGDDGERLAPRPDEGGGVEGGPGSEGVDGGRGGETRGGEPRAEGVDERADV